MVNIALDYEQLASFLSQTLQSSDFEIERINFDTQDSWGLKNGFFSHKSGGYFHVVGIHNALDNTKNLFLFQPQSAITGILICKNKGEIYILVQARIEPGNTGVIQLGPTIQSTPSNYLRVHGGKPTSYLDLFCSASGNVQGFTSSNHLDVGKRYYQKTKSLTYVFVDHLIETDNSFIWTPLRTLIQVAGNDYLLNTDLRSLLAVYDWDSLFTFQYKNGRHSSNILTYFNQVRTKANCNNRFSPLDNSEAFCVTKNTIASKNDPTSEIALYKISTKHREIDTWVQPLWKSENLGLVLLLCRNYNSERTEYLITVEYEAGVLGNRSLSASFLRYPNEVLEESIRNLGSTITEFKQSDEGGRFMNHEYLFRLAEVQPDMEIEENQFWLTIEELKSILSIPNLANVQLRNICSVLINKLNPHIK